MFMSSENHENWCSQIFQTLPVLTCIQMILTNHFKHRVIVPHNSGAELAQDALPTVLEVFRESLIVASCLLRLDEIYSALSSRGP